MGNHTPSIELCHFQRHFSTLNISWTTRDRAIVTIEHQLEVVCTLSNYWHWRTPSPVFKVTVFLKFWIYQKRCILGTKLLTNSNRKPYAIYRMVTLSMTSSDLWPGFQGYNILKSSIEKKRRILKTQLLFYTNRKLYLTYGMVPCLVTLTDL